MHTVPVSRFTHQVLVDDAVTGSEEGQHVGDEVPLLILQRLPVLQVLGQIHLDNEHTIAHVTDTATDMF